jgi:hypothetical protein
MILTVVLLVALIVAIVYMYITSSDENVYWLIAMFIALILQSINVGVHLADRNTIHSAAADGEYYLTVTLQEDPENVNFEDYQLSEKAPETKDK